MSLAKTPRSTVAPPAEAGPARMWAPQGQSAASGRNQHRLNVLSVAFIGVFAESRFLSVLRASAFNRVPEEFETQRSTLR